MFEKEAEDSFNGKKDEETADRGTPMCSDLCKHCTYIECGDFICAVNEEVSIIDWKPFPCSCPEKRKRQND